MTAPEDAALLARCAPYTLVGPARLQAVLDAVRYCVRAGIPGAFAECGVWRGGSVLAVLLALSELGVEDRDVHLFDTFTGMTEPTEADVSAIDGAALPAWREAEAAGERAWEWTAVGAEAVRRTLLATGYPPARLHLVEGPVEETLPARAPERLAFLRLDTDWYESTRHELRHLYPRLAPGGVLIVDDYGHWDGARRAVEEYFEREAPPVLLARTDYTGRMAVKR